MSTDQDPETSKTPVVERCRGASTLLPVQPRSPEWWADHTVVQLAVTHLNEHGARVLFTLPGRGLTLVAKTAEHAESQLTYARERWPGGLYEVHEVRFWREADGSPGDPVHTLVEEIPR